MFGAIVNLMYRCDEITDSLRLSVDEVTDVKISGLINNVIEYMNIHHARLVGRITALVYQKPYPILVHDGPVSTHNDVVSRLADDIAFLKYLVRVYATLIKRAHDTADYSSSWVFQLNQSDIEILVTSLSQCIEVLTKNKPNGTAKADVGKKRSSKRSGSRSTKSTLPKQKKSAGTPNANGSSVGSQELSSVEHTQAGSNQEDIRERAPEA